MDFKELAKNLRSAAILIEDLKEVKEENTLPISWSELTEDQQEAGYTATVGCNKNIEPAMEALSHLYDLRQEYWRIADWEPDWDDDEQIKFVIELFDGDYIISQTYQSRYFLTFPTEDQAKHFLKHHEGLIKEALEFL